MSKVPLPKMEWGPLAKKHLQGRQVILHTDAAKSYKTKINGVLHDNVRHGKKRVKVAGKFVWKAPVAKSCKSKQAHKS